MWHTHTWMGITFVPPKRGSARRVRGKGDANTQVAATHICTWGMTFAPPKRVSARRVQGKGDADTHVHAAHIHKGA